MPDLPPGWTELQCPKCGSLLPPTPIYCNGYCFRVLYSPEAGREHLHHACRTCGYETLGPTADADREAARA
jgi:RNase P subunit RPR2